MGAADDHYFAERPTAPSHRGSITVRAAADEFELETDRGTFSPRRLDPGTAFLLDDAPPPPESGCFLDLGCGYGPIAVSLARRRPTAQVVAVDVNERSRALCARNAAAMTAGNVVVEAPDEGARHGPFDLIWTNPPVRVGKPALHALLERWLMLLAPEGRAVIVISKNLGGDSLHRWLEESGRPTRRVGSKRGYRLLETM